MKNSYYYYKELDPALLAERNKKHPRCLACLEELNTSNGILICTDCIDTDKNNNPKMGKKK